VVLKNFSSISLIFRSVRSQTLFFVWRDFNYDLIKKNAFQDSAWYVKVKAK